MSDDDHIVDENWIEEAEIASDRAAAISMTALLELILADAIRACFISLSNTQDDGLFNDRGPLAIFHAKIDLGFALGLYGNETKTLLHTIRRIRNRFAHHHDADHFDQPDVLKLCAPLPRTNLKGAPLKSTRERFNFAILTVAMKLPRITALREASRPVPPEALP